MKVVNRKTCDGLETYVMLEGVWLRLADLPAVLRMMPARRRNEVLTDLEHRGLVPKKLHVMRHLEAVEASVN